MYTKPTRSNQQTMFFNLESQLNQKHPLYLLANKIDWNVFEEAFSPLYCEDNGRPCKSIRRMVGLLILKHVRNVSDESVVEQWQENVYYQYFCGELERNLEKRGMLEGYADSIAMYFRVLSQKRDSKDKIYSLHEPEVQCISKGKKHKKYEFGNKVSVVRTWKGLIVGALSFRNEYDGHTIDASLEQTERLTGRRPKLLAGDRGYRGQKRSEQTEVVIPGVPNKGDSYYIKRKKHELFCKRAGIEPVIGHLKSDHRLCRNFYARVFGDNINVMLSAAAFNFKRAMRLLFALLRLEIFQPFCDMLLILLPVNRIPAVAVERARGAF